MRIKLDTPLLLGEIVRFTRGISEIRELSLPITHIVTRSTLVERGDLFIPLRGKNYNGSDFIDEAINKGGIVISERNSECGVLVKNTELALLNIANGYKSKLKALKHTVAITGSVGKSTTKEFIRAIANVKFITHANEGNYNNTVGVPTTILKAKADTELLVLEAGMNSQGELALISRASEPDIAVITNIGTAHIGNLGSRESIASAKKEILLGMTGGTVIVPHEEELLRSVEKRLTVSLNDKNADLYLKILSLDAEGSYAEVFKNGKKRFDFMLAIPGRHTLSCLVCAIAACEAVGLNDDELKNGIESLSYKNTRQKYIHFKDFSIYDDSYNSSPEAVRAAFELLSLDEKSPKSALLGDMLELGRDTEALHFEIGALAAKYGMRKLYLFGVYAPFVMQGALSAGMSKSDILINTDTTCAEITAKQILKNRKKGETILFKASHALNLSRIYEHIKLLEG